MKAADVGLAHQKDGTHCGVYFTNEEDSLSFIHLTSTVQWGAPSEYYLNTVTQISEAGRIALSTLARKIIKGDSTKFRFSVFYTEDILSDGSLREGGIPGKGFTCATFVVRLFNAVPFPLIDEASWPDANDEDKAWAAKTLDYMARTVAHLNPTHWGRATQSLDHWKRILPEHVASAAGKSKHPVSFKDLRTSARNLRLRVFSEKAPLP